MTQHTRRLPRCFDVPEITTTDKQREWIEAEIAALYARHGVRVEASIDQVEPSRFRPVVNVRVEGRTADGKIIGWTIPIDICDIPSRSDHRDSYIQSALSMCFRNIDALLGGGWKYDVGERVLIPSSNLYGVIESQTVQSARLAYGVQTHLGGGFFDESDITLPVSSSLIRAARARREPLRAAPDASDWTADLLRASPGDLHPYMPGR